MRIVELVEQAFDAYNRGDFEGNLAAFDPDVEIHAAPGFINSGDFRGHDGYLAWIGQWNEAWESFTVEPISIEALDDEHVLVEVRQTGLGAGSGIEIVMNVFWAFELKDELTTRAHLYADRELALAAIESWRQSEH